MSTKSNTTTYIIIGVVIIVLIIIALVAWYYMSSSTPSPSVTPTSNSNTIPSTPSKPTPLPTPVTPTNPTNPTTPVTTPTTPVTTPTTPVTTPTTTLPNQWAWTQQQKRQAYGPKNTGNPSFNVMCANGTYLSTFSGRAGAKLDGFDMMCSDGSTFPHVGGRGGSDFPVSENADGFRKARLRWTDAVNMIQLFGTDDTTYTAIGQDNPSKSVDHGPAEVIDCGTNGRVIGFYGNTGDTVDNMGIICGTK